MTTRYALIGSGHRAQMYLDAIAGPHADVAELVALLDVNPARREFHRDRVPAFAGVRLGGPEELEAMAARIEAGGFELSWSERTTFPGYLRFHARDGAGNRIEVLTPY